MDSELLLKFPRLPFGIVAYAFFVFFGQLLSKQLYTCGSKSEKKKLSRHKLGGRYHQKYMKFKSEEKWESTNS